RQVFVSRQQKVETCGLSRRYQLAVSKPVPSSFDAFNHHMALERIPERGGSIVIKERVAEVRVFCVPLRLFIWRWLLIRWHGSNPCAHMDKQQKVARHVRKRHWHFPKKSRR